MRHFLVWEAQTTAFYPFSWEPRVKTHKDKDNVSRWAVNAHKLEEKKKQNKTSKQHLKSTYWSWSVSNQPDYCMKAALHFYLMVKSSVRRTKNTAHSNLLWIKLIFIDRICEQCTRCANWTIMHCQNHWRNGRSSTMEWHVRCNIWMNCLIMEVMVGVKTPITENN